MKSIYSLGLGLMFLVAGVVAQEQPAPAAPAAPASDAAAPADGATAPTEAHRKALEQAFDGAMTCAALTAVKANQASPADAWQWGNRSFAFGMLAVRFYTDATQKPLPNEEIDNMLTEYANAIVSMSDEKRKPFDEGCARKYADIDRLCAANSCPHKAPGSEASPTPAAESTPVPAPATDAAKPPAQ